MAKKEEKPQSLLGLVPIGHYEDESLMSYGLAVTTSTALTKTEERIQSEAHKQEFVMACNAEKNRYALEKTKEIRQAGAEVFRQTVQQFDEVNKSVSGTDIQGYVEEFNFRNTQLAANNYFALMQAGATQVADEVKRSLYLADEPERKRNALQRLMGS